MAWLGIVACRPQRSGLAKDMVTSGRNPGWQWAFADEDFVGRISKIAGKCHGRTVVARTLERYLIGIRAGIGRAGVDDP